MTVHSLLSPRLTRGRKKAGHIHLIDMAGFNAIPCQAWEQGSIDTIPLPSRIYSIGKEVDSIQSPSSLQSFFDELDSLGAGKDTVLTFHLFFRPRMGDGTLYPSQ